MATTAVPRSRHNAAPLNAPRRGARGRGQVEGAGASRWSVDDLQRRARIQDARRKRWLPHQLVGKTVVAGWLSWSFAWIAQTMSGFVAQIVVAAGVASCVLIVAAFDWRRVRRAGLEATWRRRFWIAAIFAAVWVDAVAFTGPSWSMLAAVLLAELVLAPKWWRAHRPGLPAAAAPAPAPLPVQEYSDLQRYPLLWQRHIAANGAALPGSMLTDGTETARGFSFRLQLKPGTGGLSLAMTKLEQIASGLHLSLSAVVLDSASVGLDDNAQEDISQLRLQIVRDSPIATTVDYVGPNYQYDPHTRVGKIGLGPYADGDGYAEYLLYTENSMWSGFMLGSTGAGKSAGLTGLVASARSSGHTVIFYIDPQNGASSPELAEHATWSVLDEGEFEVVTVAVEQIVKYRGLENVKNGWKGFTPTPSRPGVLIVVDESHDFFGFAKARGFAARWANIARKGRKVGVSILAASQHIGLEVFGGDDTLRSSLNSGNIIVMRTASKIAPMLIPAVIPDPNTLPADPGYAYLKPRGAGRVAPFRFAYLRDASEHPDAYNDVRALTENPEPELDELSRRAAGPALAGRGEAAEANRRAVDDQLAALFRDGPAPEAAGEARPSDGAEEGLVGPVPAFPLPVRLATADGEVIDETAAAAPGIAAPARRPGKPAVALPADFSAFQRLAVEAVLAALDDGLVEVKEIVESAGLRRQAVHDALAWLKDAEHVINPQRGQWRYPDDAEAGIRAAAAS